ncbi:hypothetical protein OAG56_03160 [Mariniblastus sp.]|nr:hypothetical protein [Pirellulaceae bacterium]MDB4756347.1 hypothetical protein [Mariniblastus sp.]
MSSRSDTMSPGNWQALIARFSVDVLRENRRLTIAVATDELSRLGDARVNRLLGCDSPV